MDNLYPKPLLFAGVCAFAGIALAMSQLATDGASFLLGGCAFGGMWVMGAMLVLRKEGNDASAE